jgi:hypothetical protein
MEKTRPKLTETGAGPLMSMQVSGKEGIYDYGKQSSQIQDSPLTIINALKERV